MEFRYPNCSQKLTTKESLRRKVSTCPRCRHKIKVWGRPPNRVVNDRYRGMCL